MSRLRLYSGSTGDSMAQIILLGSGAALSDEHREHMFMIARGKKEAIMIDCGGSPIGRLFTARVPLDCIDHIILTHHHPDHLYGLSVFLLDLWLVGRNKVLHIHGLSETLRAARGMMHAFEWEKWHEHFCQSVVQPLRPFLVAWKNQSHYKIRRQQWPAGIFLF